MMVWEVDIRHFVEVRQTVRFKASNREDLDQQITDFVGDQDIGDLMAAEGRATIEGYEIESAEVEEVGR